MNSSHKSYIDIYLYSQGSKIQFPNAYYVLKEMVNTSLFSIYMLNLQGYRLTIGRIAVILVFC